MRSPTPATVVAADEREHDAVDAVDVDRWAGLARKCLVSEGIGGELTLTFIDRADIADLNEQYMGKRGPTDVLSFPLDAPSIEASDSGDVQLDAGGGVGRGDGPPVLLGDIVISPAVAAGQYAEHAGTMDDELALLVVHGVLHILGHDHSAPDETAVMRERELALLIEHHWRGPAPVGFRQTHPD